MSVPSTHPNAFDSTDPGVKVALANMNPFIRSVLTWLHIDPALSRPTERDRLRTLVRLAAVSASNETTGKSLLVLREMWRRGFPVPAFKNPDLPPVPLTDARRLIDAMRVDLGSRLDKPHLEEATVARLLGLLHHDTVEAASNAGPGSGVAGGGPSHSRPSA